MKTLITQAAIIGSVLLFPAGAALAKGIEIETHGSLDAGVSAVSIEIEAESHGNRGRGRDHAEDNSRNASSTASTTQKGGYWSNADTAEDVRGREVGEKHRSATSTASSTRHREDNDHRGNGRGNRVQNFLAWFFGQPDSTTVGEIKAQINASTTIGSSTPGSAQGLGFFARFFGFFRHED